MARVWLPRPVGQRYQMILRLRELGVFVAGAEAMDLSELHEILLWQEERAKQPKPPKPVSKLTRAEVIQGLKEFREFRQARREGRRRLY